MILFRQQLWNSNNNRFLQSSRKLTIFETRCFFSKLDCSPWRIFHSSKVQFDLQLVDGIFYVASCSIRQKFEPELGRLPSLDLHRSSGLNVTWFIVVQIRYGRSCNPWLERGEIPWSSFCCLLELTLIPRNADLPRKLLNY